MQFFAEHIQESWQPINSAAARVLARTVESHDVVQIALALTTRRVTGEGPHFELASDKSGGVATLGDDTMGLVRHAHKRGKTKHAGHANDGIPLDDIFEAVKPEWDEFTSELYTEIVRQGYALITRGKSMYHPEFSIPHIEHIDFYDVWQRYMPREGWQYAAVWTNLTPDQERDMGIKNGDQVLDALLLIASAPTSTGKLRSKLSAAAPLIQELHGMEESMSYALYWDSHPVYVPQLSPTGPGTAKGAASAAASKIASPPYANFVQLLNDRTHAERFLRAQKLDDAEAVAEDAFKRHLSNVVAQLEMRLTQFQSSFTHNNAYAEEGQNSNARHAARPPFLIDYPMEQGDTIANGPAPQIPAGTREHKNDLIRRIYLILGVQPQLVALEHSNHAANSDIAFAGQNESIKNIQAGLEPLLAQAFRFVYETALSLSAASLGSGDEEEAKPPGAKKGERVAKHAAETAVAPDSIAHRVRVRLSATPLTTTVALEHMLKTHVIDHGVYREMVLQCVGVSSQLAARDKINFDTVDEWYHGREDESVGTKREIEGKAKKRAANADK